MRAPKPGFIAHVREVLDLADRTPSPEQIAAAQSYLAMVARLPQRDTPQPELPLPIQPRAA